QLIAVALVYFGFGFDLPMGWCLLLIAASVWLNVVLRLWFPARYRLLAPFATGLLAYDICQLSALLYLTGGIDNPFTVLLAAPVTVSAATLPSRNTMFLGAMALTTSALLIPFHLPLPWTQGSAPDLPTLYQIGAFAGVASCTVFLGFYGWRLSKESRQMSEALAATELVLAREQKLHALDGLAAAAAHELGTPLGTIVLVVKELERELASDSAHAEDLALLKSQAQRCREILQTLTRKPTEADPLHSSLTVTHLIEGAVEPHRVFRVAFEIDCGPYVGGEPGVGERGEPVGERRPGLIYGVGNLIENAVEFARSKVTVTARWNDREVMITIADDGPGFSAEVIDSLGEPYVTTRRSTGARLDEGKATGLGLGFFIAKTLLERSGATVGLANKDAPDHGAVVMLTWPRHAFEGREPIWSAFPGQARRASNVVEAG
ncbi:MAG: ActS/PrrB/RegB family redox-sensitive histidine kinase, partial [Hyphomicrobiaceae bacterium]